jgi:hypothetical protein
MGVRIQKPINDEKSRTCKATLRSLSRIWGLLAKGDGKEKGDLREDQSNVYLCELAYRKGLGEGFEGFGGDIEKIGEGLEGHETMKTNEVAGGELFMNLEFTTEGWYLRCHGIDTGEWLRHWGVKVAMGDVEKVELEDNDEDDESAHNYGKEQMYIEEAMERFITIMGDNWEPRRWSSIYLTKEGFREGGVEDEIDESGRKWNELGIEGEAYWQVRKAMQHDEPMEIVSEEGERYQPQRRAQGIAHPLVKDEGRDLALMYRMEVEVAHHEIRQERGTIHPKFMTWALYMRTRRIWAKICELWAKKKSKEEGESAEVTMQADRPVVRRELMRLEEYLQACTRAELEELSKRARLMMKYTTGRGSICKERCELCAGSSSTRRQHHEFACLEAQMWIESGQFWCNPNRSASKPPMA